MEKFNKKNKGVSHAINLYKTGASLIDVGEGDLQDQDLGK